MPNRSTQAVTRLVRRDVTPRTEIIVSAAVGVAAGLPAVLLLPNVAAGLLVGWDAATLVYVVWVWSSTWPRDAAQTERRATRFDPEEHALNDLLLLIAAVASLVAVGFVLARAGQTHLRHRVDQQRNAPSGPPARPAVLRVRHRHPRRSDQPGGQPHEPVIVPNRRPSR